MFRKIEIALSAAIVLGTALTASASTKDHAVSHVHHRAIYNTVPDTTGGGCSPIHPPLCNNICSGTGPCGPPDSW
jgi:hypothetical protein